MALHRYGDFRAEVFYFDSPCICIFIRDTLLNIVNYVAKWQGSVPNPARVAIVWRIWKQQQATKWIYPRRLWLHILRDGLMTTISTPIQSAKDKTRNKALYGTQRTAECRIGQCAVMSLALHAHGAEGITADSLSDHRHMHHSSHWALPLHVDDVADGNNNSFQSVSLWIFSTR